MAEGSTWVEDAIIVAIISMVAVVAFSCCALAAAFVAWDKGRWRLEGFLLGLMLGPIGLLIEIMLPIPAIGFPQVPAEANSASTTNPPPPEGFDDFYRAIEKALVA